MYAAFFGLQHEPFSIAPDPRYLFMSERHREALAHLLYGVQGGGGFVLLTGEIGAGKTTVCRCFLEQIPAHCQVAYIFNPRLTVTELLKTVCEEYRIPAGPATGTGEPTVKHYVDRLNAFLLESHAAGRSTVLIIDEAQNLAPELLEQLRLLTNLETNERKLLQIVLIGQPELRAMLAQPELEQLAQRVIARYHLDALSADETAHYVRHRLGVAGSGGGAADEASALFGAAGLRRIHRLARGVPRRINLLCDRALLGAYAQGRRRVDAATLERAAAEVFDGLPHRSSMSPLARRGAWALGAVGAAAAAAVLAYAGRSALLLPAPATAGAAASAAVAAAAAISATASAAAPVAVPGPFDLAALRAGEGQVWRELAQAWGAELPEQATDGDPCAALQAADEGDAALQCFRSDAGLALLRLLGRPALLQLQPEEGSGPPLQALLLGLDGRAALLRAGAGATQRVELLALQRHWRGEFITLWRLPPGGYQQGRIASAQGREWLAAQLGQAFGDGLGGGAADDEAALQARVAAFQRAQGLKSDGRAGPITLMQLNRAAGVDEPRLAQQPLLPPTR